MAPQVSIILTSYNKPYWLEKAIKSVLTQTMTDWELWIMDDHSNPETVQVIERYLGDPRISYRNSRVKDRDRFNTTRYATMINEAVPYTNGKYLTYLTDDTEFVATRLEKMVEYMEKNPQIEIAYSSQQVKIVNEQNICIQEFARIATEVEPHAAGKIDHCSIMHTKEILTKVFMEFGSYWDDDPQHWCWGDAIFWRRLNTFAPFYPLPAVLDITYKTPTSVQTLFLQIPKQLPNGTLVTGSDGEVFTIEYGERRRIKTECIPHYKYDWKRVVRIPDPLLFQYELGREINGRDTLPHFRLYQDEEGNIFYLEQEKRRPILSATVLGRYHFKHNEVIAIGTEQIRRYPLGHPIDKQMTYPLPEGKVYQTHKGYWIMHEGKLYALEQKLKERLRLLGKPIPLPMNIISQHKADEDWETAFACLTPVY